MQPSVTLCLSFLCTVSKGNFHLCMHHKIPWDLTWFPFVKSCWLLPYVLVLALFLADACKVWGQTAPPLIKDSYCEGFPENCSQQVEAAGPRHMCLLYEHFYYGCQGFTVSICFYKSKRVFWKGLEKVYKIAFSHIAIICTSFMWTFFFCPLSKIRNTSRSERMLQITDSKITVALNFCF